MLKSLQSYMYIGQSQRKGIALTFLLILSYAVFRHFYLSYDHGFLPEVKITESATNKIPDDVKAFNINEADIEQLVNAGLDKKIAYRLINFRDKINGFKNWEQIAKVYGITAIQLQNLKETGFLSENNRSIKRKKKFGNFYETGIKLNSVKNSPQLIPSAFDPNLASIDQLIAMGIPGKIAKGIVNFRKSGFQYRSADDLKKIYSMDEKTFDLLKPYVKIESGTLATGTYEKKAFSKKIQNVDINTASVDDLDELPGIGPGYANKIINWRNKLGGFHSLEQVAATYNLPDSVFQKVKSFITFKTPPEKIFINLCDESGLSKHFYIKSKEAKIIIAYRNNHGPFKNLEELMKVGALDKGWIEKMGPYITF